MTLVSSAMRGFRKNTRAAALMNMESSAELTYGICLLIFEDRSGQLRNFLISLLEEERCSQPARSSSRPRGDW